MKKINYYRWLYFIFLFAFILLFSITSLALIPGDFGSAGGGPPDGVVDFEDLMIFAMAYGSCTGDDNWIIICDIYPDGCIDFEDLMIFAMHYGECEQSTWTVILYVDGDNDLEFWAWDILGMVESVGSTAEVNIVVQLDPYDDCTGTFRYHVTGVEEGAVYPLYPEDIVQSLPEQNMSDPATLTNFINWAGDNYPADYYLLILFDHGAGWREEDEVFKGIIWDDTTGGWEHIDIPELAQCLENANINIDILVLDACNMQMIEVAYELGTEMSSPPNYLIASENTGWASGLPYDELTGQIVGNPNMQQLTICELIVNGYIDNLSTSGLPATISALHFNNEFLSNGLDIINNFANALMDSTYQEEISNARSTAQAYVLWDRPQYKDLYDFAQIIKNNVPDCQSEAQAIMDLVNNVIVAEGHTGPGMDNSHGLSIYLIDSPAEYDSSYDLLRFATDTQWDEFLQSGEGVVTGVEVIATTRQLQTTGVETEVVSIFEEESNTSKDYQIVNINNELKGETVNWILVLWDAYYEVEGYKVYKSINGGEFNMVYDWQNPPTASGYGVSDPNFSEGNTYSYYVTAYGTDWETAPSEIVTITITSETFLPACSLTNPTDGSTITEINPIFSWSPVGLGTSDLPYGEVYSGETLLIIYDANTFETVWYIWFNDMTTSTATYDQNGNANPLIPGNTYRWYIRTYGYDNNGNWVASSDSETWEFNYGGESIVTEVWAYTITMDPGFTPPDASIGMNGFRNKSAQLDKETKILFNTNFNEYAEKKGEVKDYLIILDQNSFIGASGYRVYRSVNGGNYSVVHDETATGSTLYHFIDYDTSPSNTYSYYVTAYGSDWETTPSQTVTRDTWLPPCSLISPIDESNITNPNCTFIWNPVGVSVFPYGSIYNGHSYLFVYDYITTQVTWERTFHFDMVVSTITYNDNGLAIPLVAGHNYSWNSCAFGHDEYGNFIAASIGEGWDTITGWNFTYSEN